MKRRLERLRSPWGRAIVLITLLLTVPVLASSQQQTGGETGIGLSSIAWPGDFDLSPFKLGFISFRGAANTIQFDGRIYFTIPPMWALLVSGNAVINLAPTGLIDPYFTLGVGSVVPYIVALGNIGGGLRIALSAKLALSLEYRYWVAVTEEPLSAGTIGVQLSFRR